jgi:hypothetical protein
MLWQKSWWETRRGFFTILGLMILWGALNHPWDLPDLTRWALWLQRQGLSLQQGESEWSEKGRFLILLNGWPGYVWLKWFRPLVFFWPFYSIMMTTALIKSPSAPPRAAVLFTGSLPISRRKALLTLTAVLAIEIILLTLAPSLIYAIVIRSSGRWVPIGSTVIYALLLALGGMVFVAFTFLLIAVFNSQWKAMAIGFFAVYVFLTLTIQDDVNPFGEFPPWSIYYVMSGESYFRYGRIPWLGLFVSLALSALMTLAAARIYERRDF